MTEKSSLCPDNFGRKPALVIGMVLGAGTFGLLLMMSGYADIEWTWEFWGVHTVGGTGEATKTFDRSAIFRNFGLFLLALIGIPLAVWRSWTAYHQAQIAERGQHIDRHQKGAELLESEHPYVRIAGIQTLRGLAKAEPEENYLNVLDLLYAFVREKTKHRSKPTDDNPDPQAPFLQADTYEAVKAATLLRDTIERRGELESAWCPDLKGANLYKANLSAENLSNSNFSDANMKKAFFEGTNLRNANMQSVDLSGAVFHFADLTGADLTEAKLYQADFWAAKLVSTILEDAMLVKAYLFDAELSGANLEGANLENANIENATCIGTRFREADLEGADMKAANLTDADLERARLSGANLCGANLSGAIFTNAWAHEDNPPIGLPEEIANQIHLVPRREN